MQNLPGAGGWPTRIVAPRAAHRPAGRSVARRGTHGRPAPAEAAGRAAGPTAPPAAACRCRAARRSSAPSRTPGPLRREARSLGKGLGRSDRHGWLRQETVLSTQRQCSEARSFPLLPPASTCFKKAKSGILGLLSPASGRPADQKWRVLANKTTFDSRGHMDTYIYAVCIIFITVCVHMCYDFLCACT